MRTVPTISMRNGVLLHSLSIRGLNQYRILYIKVKVKWSHYRPDVAQRVGRGIALLFHDRGTRRGWVVSNPPQPHFTPGKDPVPIVQEAGWAPGPVWTDGKSRPHRDSIPDRPARSQSLYRLSYPAHTHIYIYIYIYLSGYWLEIVDWIYAVRMRNQWLAVADTVMNVRIHRMRWMAWLAGERVYLMYKHCVPRSCHLM